MAHINLLPWREELRKQRQRDFGIAALLAAGLTGLVVLYAHLHIAHLIDYQNQRNEFLQQTIVELDKRIKEIEELEATKAKLQARINIIQQLQASRPLVVHLFDELVNTLPDGVHLTSIAQKEAAITVQGQAQSNARVSAYMRNIENSKWLNSPALDVITSQTQGRSRSNDFTLRMNQTLTQPGTPAGEPAQGDAAAPAGGTP